VTQYRTLTVAKNGFVFIVVLIHCVNSLSKKFKLNFYTRGNLTNKFYSPGIKENESRDFLFLLVLLNIFIYIPGSWSIINNLGFLKRLIKNCYMSGRSLFILMINVNFELF